MGVRGNGPLTEEEFCKLLSDANGGAKVEIKGFTPIDDADYLTKSVAQLQQDQGKTMRISRQLRDNLAEMSTGLKIESNQNAVPAPTEETFEAEERLKENLSEINRETERLSLGKETPARYAEICFFFKGYPIALANDNTAWVYEDEKWSPLKEMEFPGLPQPGQ